MTSLRKKHFKEFKEQVALLNNISSKVARVSIKIVDSTYPSLSRDGFTTRLSELKSLQSQIDRITCNIDNPLFKDSHISLTCTALDNALDTMLEATYTQYEELIRLEYSEDTEESI